MKSTPMWALCLLMTLWGSVAHAQNSRSTALLNIEGDGIDRSMTKTLTAIVRNEAQQILDYQIVNKRDIALSEILMVLGCGPDNLTCLTQVAGQVKARVLIYGSVSQEPKGVRIKLEIFDVDKKRVTRRAQRLVPSDGDLALQFRLESEAFFKGMQSDAQAATLTIASNVRGASVWLNGKEEGTIPFERPGLTPGTYKVAVKREGFSTWEAVIALTQGASLDLDAQLKRTARDPVVKKDPVLKKDPKKDPDPKVTDPKLTLPDPTRPSDNIDSTNWGGWSLLAIGGVALAGSGVMALLFEGIETDLRERTASGRIDRAEYDELVQRGANYELAHRVLLGVGITSALVGGVWVLIDAPNQGKDTTSLRLQASPTGVQALWTW